VSIDPLVADATDPQAYNAYAYARNNPVNQIDPTGRYWEGVGEYGSGHPNGGTHTTIGGSQNAGPSTHAVFSGNVSPSIHAGGLTGVSPAASAPPGYGGGGDPSSGSTSSGHSQPTLSQGRAEAMNADAASGARNAGDAPGDEIEVITVHGEAPHMGLLETIWRNVPGLRHLGRLADGAKDFVFGLKLGAGGLIMGVFGVITWPILAPVGFALGQPQISTLLFPTALQTTEMGMRWMGAGLQRSVSGLTIGLVSAPHPPETPPRRF
jgi:hypothetical protein